MQATISHLHCNLASLDTYMASISSNVELLNNYVLSQKDALEARGENSLDLLINLFRGYEAVPDHQFHLYIQNKQDNYDEGADLSINMLMEVTKNKYKMMVQEGS